MIVTTAYPVIIDNKMISDNDTFVNADASKMKDSMRKRSGKTTQKQDRKDQRREKVKNLWGKTKNVLGTIDQVGTAFGMNDPANYQEQPIAPPAPPVEEPKKMSTGLKVGLVVGGLVVVSAIIYFAMKSKTAAK